MFDKALKQTISAARELATAHMHEMTTLEHLAFVLADNPDASEVLDACGVSQQKLKEDLEAYIESDLFTITKKGDSEPGVTLGFRRTIQRAAIQVHASGSGLISGANVLVALLDEKESQAVYILRTAGLSKLEAIKFITRDGGKFKSRTRRGRGRDDDDDDDEDGSGVGGGVGGRVGGGEMSEEEMENDFQRHRRAMRRRRMRERMGREEGETPEDMMRKLHELHNKKQRGHDTKQLREHCTDLIRKARKGEIDPLIGRDSELARIAQVLCRRTKNNPLLVGEAGVGKTAIAEGLALKIVRGEVPEPLLKTRVWALDIGALIAGTRYRGDFEERIKGITDALNKQKSAILFVDEIHTLVHAGAASGGSLDASNLLKPALQGGRIRCIGSTTYREYRSHLDKDKALLRRFQKIDIGEPSTEDSIRILEGLKPLYEDHHKVRYSKPALHAAVDLSSRFLHDRRLPDKAIDVIDEAGAAARIANPNLGSEEKPRRISVGVAEIETVIASIARIPKNSVSKDDRQALKALEDTLKQRVFGQDKAVSALADAVRTARAGLRESEKPVGCYLFSGPTGVGKTEAANQLAKTLAIPLKRFDMSEYMERHSVSRLIGTPPGYVGFEQGGLLTDAIDENPHAVLLLDEIEKAHSDIFSLLLQVMDYGKLTDHNGRSIDFRNVIVILTTNAGAVEQARAAVGFERERREGEDDEAVRQLFPPEFRNRLDATIAFHPLSEDVMLRIVDKFIAELEEKLQAQNVHLELDGEARTWLAQHGHDPAFGARPLARLIGNHIKKPLANLLLFDELSNRGGTVRVRLGDDGLVLDAQAAPKKKRKAKAKSRAAESVEGA